MCWASPVCSAKPLQQSDSVSCLTQMNQIEVLPNTSPIIGLAEASILRLTCFAVADCKFVGHRCSSNDFVLIGHRCFFADHRASWPSQRRELQGRGGFYFFGHSLPPMLPGFWCWQGVALPTTNLWTVTSRKNSGARAPQKFKDKWHFCGHSLFPQFRERRHKRWVGGRGWTRLGRGGGIRGGSATPRAPRRQPGHPD